MAIALSLNPPEPIPMSHTLLWSLGLMILAFFCLVVEFFVPSAGLIGIGAAIAFAAAIFVAFTDSTSLGMTFTAVVALAVPLVMLAMIRIWPYTPVGRRMLNLPPNGHAQGGPAEDPRMRQLRELVGRVGRARTDLLPSGQIEVDGRRFDAVASGAAIDRDSPVEVFSVEMGKIHVRPTDRTPAAPKREANRDSAETPLEELGLEDLGDPLG